MWWWVTKCPLVQVSGDTTTLLSDPKPRWKREMSKSRKCSKRWAPMTPERRVSNRPSPTHHGRAETASESSGCLKFQIKSSGRLTGAFFIYVMYAARGTLFTRTLYPLFRSLVQGSEHAQNLPCKRE